MRRRLSGAASRTSLTLCLASEGNREELEKIFEVNSRKHVHRRQRDEEFGSALRVPPESVDLSLDDSAPREVVAARS